MYKLIEPIINSMKSITVTDVINVMLVLILVLSIANLISAKMGSVSRRSFSKKRRKINLMRLIQNEDSKSKLLDAAEVYLMYRKKKYTAKQLYYMILLLILVTLVIFIYLKNILLAALIPLSIYLFSISFLKIKSLHIREIFVNQLPGIINNTIKVMSKYDDLKTVIFELSQGMKQPARGYLLKLSRKMITTSYDDALLDFADEIQSIWVYAYVFLLMNYRKESKKSDIVFNLRVLARMLEEENMVQNKKISERKGLVTLNNLLSFLALVGFFANLGFNSNAYEFFFETASGMTVMTIGIVCLFLVMFVNVKIMKKEYR